ncbi:MAG: hypothetical protein AAGD43_14800, partial [Pseudomonadota bacterium]
TRYILIASMDVDPAQEALFNEIYDSEHVQHLLGVLGVRSVSRYKGVPFALAIADGIQEVAAPKPVHTAIYELDHPDVLASPEWSDAVERGRWGGEVRPYTRNCHHAVYEQTCTTDEVHTEEEIS